jgi:acyl carrier protein
MTDEMKSKIKNIISKQLAVAEEQVTDDASFVEDLNADSLDLVEMIMAFEEEFSIEIHDEEAENIKTVKDIYTYIDNRLGEKSE